MSERTAEPSSRPAAPEAARCRHGRVLPGCGDDACPEQQSYLDGQRAAFVAHQVGMLDHLRDDANASSDTVRWDGTRWVSAVKGWVYLKNAGRHGTGALFPVPAGMSDEAFIALLDERYGAGQW